MARIAFKAKVETLFNVDGTVAYKYINVPALKRNHCNMHEFRVHSKYGAYANSDLFEGILRRIRSTIFPALPLKLDAIPKGVTVDTTGFLARVSFEV